MKLKVHEHNKNNLKIVSKTKILLLLLMAGTMGYGQNKLFFEYDAAGNQVVRNLCINCFSSRVAATSKTVKQEEMTKSEVSDKIKYYPNPVLEELYVSWELIDDKKVTAITLYNMNGLLLNDFKSLEADSILTIPFITYPSGLYIVTFVYSDGKSKSIKVEKK